MIEALILALVALMITAAAIAMLVPAGIRTSRHRTTAAVTAAATRTAAMLGIVSNNLRTLGNGAAARAIDLTALKAVIAAEAAIARAKLHVTALAEGVDLNRMVRRCRSCGCTEMRACFPTCWWVEADLCSACDGRGIGRGLL